MFLDLLRRHPRVAAGAVLPGKPLALEPNRPPQRECQGKSQLLLTVAPSRSSPSPRSPWAGKSRPLSGCRRNMHPGRKRVILSSMRCTAPAGLTRPGRTRRPTGCVNSRNRWGVAPRRPTRPSGIAAFTVGEFWHPNLYDLVVAAAAPTPKAFGVNAASVRSTRHRAPDLQFNGRTRTEARPSRFWSGKHLLAEYLRYHRIDISRSGNPSR